MPSVRLDPTTSRFRTLGEILLSQIPALDQIWWLSILAALMSFTYSTIGLALGIARVVGIIFNTMHASDLDFEGNLTGISVGTMSQAQKIWRSFRALGDIAFAYSFSMILIEIQDTLKSPPAEAKTMRKATKLSIAVTTVFYMLCGCMGYASFGDFAPENLLTGFGNPFWLVDIANAAIVIHLVGAYQVFCQPIFTFIEQWARQRWPKNKKITKEFEIPVPILGYRPFKLNLDVVGILGALGFWPLTVYFPVEMYIEQKKISKWSSRWICLKTLSLACLMIRS
ncbi:Amino acid permease 5 [Hibiscus syriacus]|uniref:Amino acid permease 5 n=1 Tax=Hibiscus syriacus TaxID=106335 RepID=A0A6A2ZRA9_HIBSY|nr:Amino acid permease 5 [Hibiscus syriacus]